jgi:hypothetical protein
MTIDKGFGFIRNINLAWLDAASDARLRNDDMQVLREELDQYLKHEMEGVESRRKTIDVLIGIWHKTVLVDKSLHAQALDFLLRIPANERIWLHYGLTLLSYPFFRQTAAVIGQFARTGEPVTRLAVKNRLAAEIGHLGSLNRAAERVVASLVNWGILTHQKKGNLYLPQLQATRTGNPELQCWLLVCALTAHPSDQLPFSDLIRLPELFPFKFTVTLDHIRTNTKFNVQRQGMWDMVSMREP